MKEISLEMIHKDLEVLKKLVKSIQENMLERGEIVLNGDLKNEFQEWDSLSDEAFEDFEKNL